MGQLQTYLPELEKLGYRVIAISGDPLEKVTELAQKLGAGYEILADPGLAVTRQYGIVFQAGERQPLPVPAVFVVGTARGVRFHYVHPDY
ncbi:MAG: redoxin domain-containing protein, partial [bacterium]|nr:redoxin domain-containing protein [bacterium]